MAPNTHAAAAAAVRAATTIDSVSKYVALPLSFTAILLCTFAFLSPVLLLPGQVSLLLVKPSTALLPNNSGSVDRPTVVLGALGSCSRLTNNGRLVCTSASLGSHYDLGVLPNNPNPNILLAPAIVTPVFIAISLALSGIFFLVFIVITFRDKLSDSISSSLQNRSLHRVVLSIGIVGYVMGITSFLVFRMWFGKAVEDFNSLIWLQGSNSPALIAEVSNGFIMAWVGYAFLSVPLLCLLLHPSSRSNPS